MLTRMFIGAMIIGMVVTALCHLLKADMLDLPLSILAAVTYIRFQSKKYAP